MFFYSKYIKFSKTTENPVAHVWFFCISLWFSIVQVTNHGRCKQCLINPPLSHHHSISTSHSISLIFYLSISASQFVPLNLYLLICISQSLPLNLYLSFSTFQSVPLNLYLSISTSQFVPLNLYFSISTSLSLPLNLYLSISASQYVPLNLYLSVYTPLIISLTFLVVSEMNDTLKYQCRYMSSSIIHHLYHHLAVSSPSCIIT